MAIILLRHVGGETREVEVLGFYGSVESRQVKYHRGLDIKWGNLAGTYKLDLRKNRLTGAPSWSAIDIKKAWAVWYGMADPKGVHSRPAGLSGNKPSLHGCPASGSDIVISNLRKVL